ncbi:MAG: type II and III secretion system protein, partial [Verrucomicrobia bacterium]|nr:type II and III secretion system protein [Verrucomicrobiota bacterium]
AVPPAGGGVVQQANAPVFEVPQTQILPFGPVLDVVPYISADGYTVQMTIIPTITEFVGYDDPGQFVPQAITGAGVPLTSVLPLPRFRLRQVTTSAVVWDGQTIVLGGLLSEDVRRLKDKVPVLGDIPFLGRFFRSEASSTAKKNLMIFVTPTIIDPAGNRLHSEDELPFNPNMIPVQTMGMAQ